MPSLDDASATETVVFDRIRSVTMTKWLHSGRRRDICAILYDAGELRAQSLKNRIETHYDERIDPGSFYGTMSALVDSGHLERRTEGIADVYALTDAGERALLDHYAWLSERLGDADSIVKN
ncbi:PadR family transcriptional regulator [Halorubrum luteum]